MSVTAIIPHYWNSRRADLPQIVAALQSGEVQPWRVIIWNNTPNPIEVGGSNVINAGGNWGITARFAAAYLARTEFVLFQDNDVLVQSQTLLNLLDHAPEHGVSVEMQGRNFGSWPSPYTRSDYVDGYELTAPQAADIGLSRISLMRRSTAMRLAGIIPPDATDDDIWTSRHAEIRIVPARDGCGYQNLPESEGLCRDVNAHVGRRDALVRQLWPERAGERQVFESTVVRV